MSTVMLQGQSIQQSLRFSNTAVSIAFYSAISLLRNRHFPMLSQHSKGRYKSHRRHLGILTCTLEPWNSRHPKGKLNIIIYLELLLKIVIFFFFFANFSSRYFFKYFFDCKKFQQQISFKKGLCHQVSGPYGVWTSRSFEFFLKKS